MWSMVLLGGAFENELFGIWTYIRNELAMKWAKVLWLFLER